MNWVILAAFAAVTFSVENSVASPTEISTTTEIRQQPVDSPFLNQTCKNADGQPGVCTYFRDCYPILWGFEKLGKKLLDSQLLLDVLETTQSCLPAKDGARDTYDIICCITPTQVSGEVVRITQTPTQSTTPDPEREYLAEKHIFRNITDAVEAPTTKSPNSEDLLKNVTSSPPLFQSPCISIYVVNIPAPINEAEAPHGAYPWMVALMNNRNSQFCGGSLIDNYHILTAAHCIAHFKKAEDLKKMKVMAGIRTLLAPEPSKVERNVVEIFRHAQYSDKNFTNDIAILKLEKPIEFAKYTQPICLNKEDDYSNGTTQAILAGWGRTSVIGGPSPTLRHATMRVWKNQECKDRYKDGFLGDSVPEVQPTMVCAGSPGVDACQGDSGGPLFRKRGDQGHYEQIGIVSWGVGCGLYPAVYTRVDQYMDWINTQRGIESTKKKID